MSENQFGTGDIPAPPPDPSGGANILAMQESGRLASAMLRRELPGAPKPREQIVAQPITDKNNPANEHEARMLAERGPRLSLNAPQLNLSVPQIEGYHLHWFLETNVPLAIRGWYEFVNPGEVNIPDKNIGGRPNTESEDLGGNRVTQINKGPGADGRPIQFVLMKIRQEWYHDEQRILAERNYSILVQIFRHKLPIRAEGEKQTDYDKRYTREAVIDMSAGRFVKRE
jgi:hypothetical protein